jgi:peptidyl-prolyl cis-trans isomerase SurA
MKRIICFLLVVYFFLSVAQLHAAVVDKVAVVVNDEIITQGEIDKILYSAYQQFKVQYSDEELEERINEARTSLVKTLIEDRLLLSEAKRRNIMVSNKEVQERMDEVRSQFKSEKEFRTALEADNITIGELEKRYKERIMRDKVIDIEIRGSISVSPQEVVEFYKGHKEEFKEPEKIKLRSILIRVTDERPRDEALKLAQTILVRLEEGGDFMLLADRYSEGPHASSGGDMGWVRNGELLKRINDVVFTLNDNEISGIIETNLGFHIFKAENREESRELEFSEVKDHIEQMIYAQKTNDKIKSWIDRLKENAYIAFR